MGTGARNIRARITRMTQGKALQVEALSYEAGIYDDVDAPDVDSGASVGIVYGPPQVALMDLPLITGAEVPSCWRGGGVLLAVRRGELLPLAGDDRLHAEHADRRALHVGETEFDLFSGPTSRFDRGNILRVKIFTPDVTLESVSDLALFDGANTLAIEGKDGNWEVLQFRDAQLVSPGVYDLTNLLRGQYGTEDAMADPVASGGARGAP